MLDWEIRQGDCLDLLRAVPDGSVDAIVTDPPYGLSFLGAGWDHAVPGVAFWSEALRVAKPGAHLLAFGGTRTFHRLAVAVEDAGWEIRDTLSWLYGEGFPKSHNGPWGGTALKPGWEPIVMARKPLRGTVAANHEAFGTGALNIDRCKIGTGHRLNNSNGDLGGRMRACNRVDRGDGRTPDGRDLSKVNAYVEKSKSRAPSPVVGRWPANVCLDSEAADLLDCHRGQDTGGEYNDTGGASRFFYVAKPDRAERDMGIRLPEIRGKRCHAGGDDTRGRPLPVNRNNHPTVKPVALMRWLCRLVTPPGGLVLDPFCGSGTTGVAAVGEGLRFVGMELEPRFVEISRARLTNTQPPLFAQ